MTNPTCCFCGPVRSCAPFLNAVFNNIRQIGEQVFDGRYAIIVSFDKSNDNSLALLKFWKRQFTDKYGISFHLHVNSAEILSPYRTHRIAAARNACLDILRREYPSCPFFAMMDFDAPNSMPCHPHILQKYFDPTKLLTKWDALSFQTAPHYYDIWALSIPPFSFSYNHFPNNGPMYGIIQKYIDRKLRATRGLVSCISAFNGFSFYKTNKFDGVKYYGDIRASIQIANNTKPHWIQEHKQACLADDLVFLDYGHVKGTHEDCEHRPFHMLAIKRHDARIRISPEVLFR